MQLSAALASCRWLESAPDRARQSGSPFPIFGVASTSARRRMSLIRQSATCRATTSGRNPRGAGPVQQARPAWPDPEAWAVLGAPDAMPRRRQPRAIERAQEADETRLGRRLEAKPRCAAARNAVLPNATEHRTKTVYGNGFLPHTPPSKSGWCRLCTTLRSTSNHHIRTHRLPSARRDAS